MFLWSVAYGQVCADEDTVRANAVSLITATTARINGTVAHFTGSPTSLQLRYVRVGQTDTATASSAPTTALRNLTGLQPNTQYVYYYKTICGSNTQLQTIGAYTFTTLASTIVYATERSTQFRPYALIDSVLQFGATDTTLNRAQNLPSIAYKSSNNTFYGYYPSCTCWRPLAIDSSGIIALLDGKVDSVTVSGDSLFYWKVGVSYGYVLPALNNVWRLTGNSGTDTSVNWIGTNDAKDLRINANGARRFTVNTNGALGIGAAPDYGTSGYLLQSAGSGAAPAWTNYTLQDAYTAGSTLTSNTVTANNTLQGWQWNTHTGVVPGFLLTSTSTAMGAGGASLFGVSVSGANAAASRTSVAGNFSSTRTGTTSTNVAISASASGATTNYGIYVSAGLVNIQGLTASLPVFTDASKNLTNTGVVPLANGGTNSTDYRTATETLTNKRWTARVGSTTSSATPTINTDNYDVYKLTAQTNDITSFTTNLSGTPADGDILEIQITDNGTARAITWGASFVSTTVTLPTTTTISTTLTVIFQYYTTSSYGNNKWHCVNYY